MEQAQYEQIVRQLEVYARAHPFGYRVRVFLLALLSYLVVGMALVVAVALTALALYLIVRILQTPGPKSHARLLFPVIVGSVVFAGMILRSLWVRFEAPSGIRITPKDSPRLFQMLESMRRVLGAPRIHEVALTPSFNAGIVQIPRLGLLGWYRNYLLVGLPLMQGTSPEQLRAVIAHEMGHLAGKHGRFSSWVYRLVSIWSRFLDELEEREHWSTRFWDRFFAWYEPYFSAYTFVLRRAHESEADRCAVRLTNPRQAGSTLIQVYVVGNYFADEFLDRMLERAKDAPQPTSRPFTEFSQHVLRGEHLISGSFYLFPMLCQETGVDDTHPSLLDRLVALGLVNPKDEPSKILESALTLLQPIEETAESWFLGERAKLYAEQFDKYWQDAVLADWVEIYKTAQQARERIRQLEQQPNLKPEQLFELAQLKYHYQSPREALAVLKHLIVQNPNLVEAQYLLGVILLKLNQEEGIAVLERVMQMDSDSVLYACEHIYAYLYRHGRYEEAKHYRKLALTSRILPICQE